MEIAAAPSSLAPQAASRYRIAARLASFIPLSAAKPNTLRSPDFEANDLERLGGVARRVIQYSSEIHSLVGRQFKIRAGEPVCARGMQGATSSPSWPAALDARPARCKLRLACALLTSIKALTNLWSRLLQPAARRAQ
jgi:hypothetical protein